mmetsp:Transcript_4316/g.9772  ORF Transcript_4316/g.9772 Transcript_4316/m.9772 type:complete len:236 (-) Transcript_4316:2050-2757(-)
MSVASFTLFGIRIQKFEFHSQQEKVLIHGNYPSRENFTSNVDKLVLHKEQPTMPPKKSKVKKPSSNKDADLDGMDITLPEDRIKYLESHTQALELQLVYRTEQTSNAVAECDALREKLTEATQKCEDEKKLSMEVMRAMTRQYKGMQEDLLNKINERERVIQTLRDTLETQRISHIEHIAAKDEIIERKNAAAAKMRDEEEAMCQQFVKMIVDARIKLCNQTKMGDTFTLLTGDD